MTAAPPRPVDAAGLAGLPVALLLPTFWPEVHRGGERIVRELADGLLTAGLRPRLITSHPGPPRRSVEDGLRIVRQWRPPDARLRRRAYEDHLTHVPLSYLELVRGDDRLAHALFPTDGVAAGAWAGRTGRPAILTYLGIPDRAHLVARRLRVQALVRAVDGSAAVTALSRTAADAFGRWLGVRPDVIPPAVDLEAFAPGGERAPEPTVLCAADVESPMKRVDLLVGAWPAVTRARPGARLQLLRPRDPRTARELTERGIALLDPVADPRALAERYRRAWVSALPSRGDSFGLVLAEALACGTPVVGSRHGALPELVDRPEIGRLIAADDPGAVARALLEGLELAEDGGAAAACRARAEDFAPERSLEAYLRLYAEVLDGRPRERSRAGGGRPRPIADRTPDVSVVVPATGDPIRLRWLLQALREQTLDPDRFEVVVAHPREPEAVTSLLATHDLAAAGRLRAVEVAERRGAAPAGTPRRLGPSSRPSTAALRNAGWRAARAPLVAFTEVDCRPAPDWLERAVAAAGEVPGAVVQGATRPDPEQEAVLVAAPHGRSRRLEPPTAAVEACNAVYPRELLERLGGFDEALAAGDRELGLRARDMGADVVAEPRALVHAAVHAGWLGSRLASAWRGADAPELVRRHPRLRCDLALGVFSSRRHAWLALGSAGVAVARGGRRGGWALALPWALSAARLRGPDPRGAVRAAAELPGELAIDLVEVVALARASLRQRTLVL